MPSVSDRLTTAELIVVGAGLFGLCTAERAASELGARVVVVDRRAHVGGNAHSSPDPVTGIEVHDYGTHIFHTSNARVWHYLQKFSAFTSYEHRVWTQHGGRLFPMPINLATISLLLGRALSPAEAKDFLAQQVQEFDMARRNNFEDRALAAIGPMLYEAFIRGYTRKQWQVDPRLLPASVFTRLPLRLNMDTRYFSDTWQGLPADGYAAMMQSMLQHPRIDVLLDTDFFEIRRQLRPDQLIVYTGPVDRYFDFREGHLGWRTLHFEREVLASGDYQGTSVMNFADDTVPYTRIHEFRHLHPERAYPTDRTVIMREFSRSAEKEDEPYYPLSTPEDRSRLQRYREAIKGEKGVFFGGRLASYQYLDMDMAVASALTLFENAIAPEITRRRQGTRPG